MTVSHSLHALYVVGPATANAVRVVRDARLPDVPVVGEEAGKGTALAPIIVEHYYGRGTGADDSAGETGGGRGGERGEIGADGAPTGTTTGASATATTSTTTTSSSHDQPLTMDKTTANNRKRTILFLTGAKHRDDVPRLLAQNPEERRRIRVDELVVYETAPTASFVGDLRDALKRATEMVTGEGAGGADLSKAATEMEEGLGQATSAVDGDEKGGRSSNAGGGNNNNNKGNGDIVWLVLFSPGCCEIVLDALAAARTEADRSSGTRYALATIGPTSADTVRRLSKVGPDVCAATPTPEGVGAGIEQFKKGIE